MRTSSGSPLGAVQHPPTAQGLAELGETRPVGRGAEGPLESRVEILASTLGISDITAEGLIVPPPGLGHAHRRVRLTGDKRNADPCFLPGRRRMLLHQSQLAEWSMASRADAWDTG